MTDEQTDGPAPVEVGRVVKPHGIRGEVSIELLTDRPHVRFAEGAELWLDGTVVTIAAGRPHKGRWLVRFTDVEDRTRAESLRGAVLTAPVLEGDAEADTFWIHELVGMRVLDDDEEEVGEVASVIEMPVAAGYDLLEVRRPSGARIMLPAADELVEARETDDGFVLVVVDPPPGLLDDDEAIEVRSELTPPDDAE